MLRFLCSTALLILALPAHALDPFATEADLAPPFVVCRPAPSLLGLVDAVDAALCANPQTRAVWANARAQAAQVGVAKSAYLPSLNVSVGEARVRSLGMTSSQRSAQATLAWLVYDFGARSATLENARQLLAAAVDTMDATVQSLFLSTVQTWYQVQAADASLAATRESERVAETSYKAAAARYQAGTGTPADTLQARTALSQATLARITAEGSLKIAQGSLNLLLGRDAPQPLHLAADTQAAPPPHFEQDVDALIAEARRRRPDLRSAQAQTAAAQASVDAARAAHLPSLSFGVSGSDVHNASLGESRGGSLGLTLNIPLFTGFATTYRVRAAQAQAESRAASEDQLRLQVAQDVWNAYQSLLTATQTTRSSADLLASAEAADKVARGRYQAGVGSMLDLLNAQNALASARQQQVQSLYSWNVARAALAQSMGTLDRDLVLSLQEDRTP